jgi:hypothetical protein
MKPWNRKDYFPVNTGCDKSFWLLQVGMAQIKLLRSYS